MDFNMRIPEITVPDFSEEEDCEHISFCSKLGIITSDCRAGAHPRYRCTQGDYAQIQLLSRILEALDKRLD